MPHSFVNLFPELEQACQASLVLTTTERLRRNLILAYNRRQKSTGRSAWSTPRVQTLDGHLAGLHQRSAATRSDLPTLLSAEAEYHLFRITAPDGADRLVPMAQQAWRICRHWQIPISPANFSTTENGRLFLDWSERVMRRLAARQAVTRADLASSEWLLSSERRLTCLAFEALPSLYTQWLDRQRAAGVIVDSLRSEPVPQSDVQRMSFDNPEQELSAAAQWARTLLCETPLENRDALHVGIVIPDLETRHSAVVRQFTAELDPLLDTGTDGLVDIGGGVPLDRQPVWQAASDWLSLCYDRLPLARAQRCLSARYLAIRELNRWPATLPPLLSLQQLAGAAARRPDLAALARSLAPRAAQSVGLWLSQFLQDLDRAGWDGRRAGSFQYQALKEIRLRIEAFADSADGRAVSAGAALGILNHYLSTVTFAPERSPAPIQIMGTLETTGLTFSHLWVTGLDDQTWPQSPSHNPFIPIGLSRRFNVSRSTPEQETSFARERLSQWQMAAPVVRLSHARHAAESDLRPSPLIRWLPETTDPVFQHHRAHPMFEHRRGHIETLLDNHGSELAAGGQRGGTGRIRDQAICPFKGFAVHRLGLKEERLPHGLPDALDRGTLIHEALHLLYQGAAERGRTAQELGPDDFARAAEQAISQLYQRFPTPFRQRERGRLAVLLQAWNVLEARRTDVRTEALELGIDADFDGLGLNLRLDRLDRIDGALFVIDYKTGRIGNRLNHERLIDPQLPLYALTNEDVEGVLYAEINETRPRLKGISEHSVAEAAVEPPYGGSWQAQRSRWQRQIELLTEEIRTGAATVAPYARRACQNCHLSALCRIDLDANPDPTAAEPDWHPDLL